MLWNKEQHEDVCQYHFFTVFCWRFQQVEKRKKKKKEWGDYKLYRLDAKNENYHYLIMLWLVCIESSKYSTDKLSELVSELNISDLVDENKANVQKSIAFGHLTVWESNEALKD